MSITAKIRAKSPVRRGRTAAPEPGALQAVADDEQRCHPAMSGLSVSPVHGRHCICERCDPEHLRLAG